MLSACSAPVARRPDVCGIAGQISFGRRSVMGSSMESAPSGARLRHERTVVLTVAVTLVLLRSAACYLKIETPKRLRGVCWVACSFGHS